MYVVWPLVAAASVFSVVGVLLIVFRRPVWNFIKLNTVRMYGRLAERRYRDATAASVIAAGIGFLIFAALLVILALTLPPYTAPN